MIYLDNAATTPVFDEVLEDIAPYFNKSYYNPSSIYSGAEDVYHDILHVKSQILSSLKADDNDEVYFTSGGTESDNWAIKGYMMANKDRGNHIITTKIEHHAVLNTCKWLEDQGFDVTYLDVDKYGRINLSDLERSITENTLMVSVIYANNEIGTIQDVKSIGDICKKHNIVFHTDAVQAFCHIPIDVTGCNIDMLSASGHKFNALKGVGFLYVKYGVELSPIIHGGSQQSYMRGGTYNVTGIMSMRKAIEMNTKVVTQDKKDYLVKLLSDIPYMIINGQDNSLPGILSVSFKNVEAASLLFALENRGIICSAGSACSSSDPKPSHVLSAIGVSDEYINGTIRLSFDDSIRYLDLDYVSMCIHDFINRLGEKC